LFANAEWEQWDSAGNPSGWTGFWHVPSASGAPQPLLGPIGAPYAYQGASSANCYFPAQPAGTDQLLRLWPVTAIACTPGATYYTSTYVRSLIAGAGGLELLIISAPAGTNPDIFQPGTNVQVLGRFNLSGSAWQKYDYTFQVPLGDVNMRVGWCPGCRTDKADTTADNNIFADTMVLKRIDPYGAPALAGNGTALTAAHSDHWHGTPVVDLANRPRIQAILATNGANLAASWVLVTGLTSLYTKGLPAPAIVSGSRVAVTADGEYMLTANNWWTSLASGQGTLRALQLRKNSGGSQTGGTLIAQSNVPVSAAGANSWAGVTKPVELLSGDYVEMFVWHNATGSVGLLGDAAGASTSLTLDWLQPL
jgi:hypothetical protein